jgi:hypothetical protein
MSKYSHLYKYITDIKIVDDNIIFPCIEEHIIPIKLLDIILLRYDTNTNNHYINCKVCELSYCDTYTVLHLKDGIDQFYIEYSLKNIVHQYIISNKGNIVEYEQIKNCEFVIHKKIYDNFYEYDLNLQMFSFNDFKTNNYQLLKEYMITIFNNMLLPDICRIVLDYILIKDNFDLEYEPK